MSGTTRKLMLAAAALLALIVAGSVGAVIRATVFNIPFHKWAYLAGTNNVYCWSYTQTWTPAKYTALSFDCYFIPAGSSKLTNGYSATINRNGVTVYLYRSLDNGKRIRQFTNPGILPPKSPGGITIPSSLAVSGRP